jgi:GxxExxY protein
LVHVTNKPQMNADERRYMHEQTNREIIGVLFDVYNELGYGFLESVYREAMTIALQYQGLQVEREFPLTARFRGQLIGNFKADLVVRGSVIVDLKAVRSLEPAHEAQILNYLRASVLEVGLLLNFGPKPQVRRLAFSNRRKNPTSVAAIPPDSSISVHLR